MRWYGSLRRSAAFARVRRRGRGATFRTVRCYWVDRPGGRTRIGVSVSAAVGGAVVRNRVRRRIKGALDAVPPEARRCIADLVFVALPDSAAVPYVRLAADVRAAVARLTEAHR